MPKKGKKEKSLADKEIEIVQKFKKVFSGPDGEAVLKHLMKQTHVMESVVHTDPHQMAWMDGKRTVTMEIIQMLQMDEKAYLEILEDSRDDLINEQDLF